MGAGAKWPGVESIIEQIRKPKIDNRKTPAGGK